MSVIIHTVLTATSVMLKGADAALASRVGCFLLKMFQCDSMQAMRDVYSFFTAHLCGSVSEPCCLD